VDGKEMMISGSVSEAKFEFMKTLGNDLIKIIFFTSFPNLEAFDLLKY